MKKRLTALVLAALTLYATVLPAQAATKTKQISTNIPTSFTVVKQDPSSTVISFWHIANMHRQTALDNICSWFNGTVGRKKKIYVKPIYQGGYSDITIKLQASIQANNPKDLPDIVQLSAEGFFAAKESTRIISLDDLIAYDKSLAVVKETMNPAQIYMCSYKGEQYGMPFMNSVVMMHYNKDAFKAAGMDPEKPPKTMAEYADAIKKLVVKKGNHVVRYGGSYRLTSFPFWTWIPRQKGGTGFEFNNDDGFAGMPTKFVADTDGTMKATLTEWKKVQDTGAYNSNPGSYMNDYTSGYSCSMIGSQTIYEDAVLALKTQKDKSKSFTTGLARLFSVNANDAVGTCIGGSAVYMFDRGIEKAKIATIEFLKFLSSTDVSAYWTVKSNYFPLNTNALKTKYVQDVFSKDSEKYKPYSVLEESAAYPKFQLPLIPAFTLYDACVGGQVLLLAQNKTTVDKAVEKIAKKANNRLDTYRKANQ